MEDPSPSTTPTIIHDVGQNPDNQEAERELFPGAEEQRKNPHLVEFDVNDPANPKNWSRAYRWFLTMFSGLLVLNASFASSAPSGIATNLMEQFRISEEVATLTIALFVFGYCVGPFFWGPMSEQYGRRPIFIVSFAAFTGFQVGCALSQNTASILIFRLLSGTFAAAPLTNSGALIADIWDADTRGKALALFTVAPFAGPALGPLVGGYISTSGTSWRWLFWVLVLFAGSCFVAIIFLLPETYAPAIMVSKAKAMRVKTGDDKYYAPLEAEVKKSFMRRLEEIVARPFRILFQEPMLIAITVYMSFVYGCVYLLFEAFPIVFSVGHGFSAGASGLTFLPVFGGAMVAVIIYIAVFDPAYGRLVEQYKPNPVPPEHRLDMAIVGAPVFAISFFWFGWTSYPSISFWVPMMAGGGMGLSVVFIFLPLFNYIIDSYLFIAASALAANTVFRSLFGAVFPLFATQMYDALGARWASTLVGCVAVVMIPIPLLLKRYGPAIRRKSKHAPSLPPPVPKETSGSEEPKV
ncbi:hypothetical protein M0805_009786 [Coniferiporia weirii]|nr:hypothetical protein M0805_009786 [Coniferiporia weirii]